jgi:hypothetical protein
MVALLAAVVLVACRKDASNGPVPVDNGMASVNVTSLVRSFVDHARGAATPKVGATLSADSAEWYVEAALNYSVAKAWIEYDHVTADSAVVSVPLNAGEVPVTAAYEAFNTLHALLATVEEEGVQHLAIVDVAAKEAGSELRLEVRYLVGSGYGKSVNAYYAPDEALMWWQWSPTGNCSCSPTVPSALCANQKIRQRVQQAIQVPMGPYDYWTNVETWYVGSYYYDDPSNNQYGDHFFQNPNNTSGKSNQDFLIYLCGDGNCDSCLEHDDLSHHTQGTYDVMMWIKSNHCSSKTAYTLTVDGDLIPGIPGALMHICTFTYGIKSSGSSS